MSENKSVMTSDKQTPDQSKEPAIRPWVDIFEDETGITLEADMPGVSKERLDLSIDNDTLTIEGWADLQMPDGMEALHADIRFARYRSSYSLSQELDRERIEATMENGVLNLRIPKRAELQPRKIEVKTH